MKRLHELIRGRRAQQRHPGPPVPKSEVGDPTVASGEEVGSGSLVDRLERAVDLAVEGKLDSLTHDRLVEEAAAHEDLEAMVLLADLALRLADYETALERANVVLDKDPGNVPTLRIAGHAALGMGEVEHATSFFTRALPLDKRRARAFAALARAYLEAGEYERASHLYRKASREGMWRSSEIKSWHRAETLNAVDGRPQMVVETALASSDASPEALVPWFRLLVNQHPEAEGLSERLEEAYLATGSPELAFLWAKHLLDTGEWEAAYECLQDARSAAANDTRWYRLMRRVLQSVPPGFEVAESMEDITRQGLEVALRDLEGNPHVAEAYLTLSRFCRDAETSEDSRPFPQTPGKDQALDFAAAALTLSSERMEADLSVIDLLIRQRRFADAVWRAERSIEKWPDAPETWAAASTARLSFGDVVGAVQAAHEGLARHPGHHACRTALVTAAFAANDRSAAAVHAMGIGVETDIGSKRLRIDASLRVGDVMTALGEHGSLSIDSGDAPTWMQDASESLHPYGRDDSISGEPLIVHVEDGALPWPSEVLSDSDSSTAVLVVRGAEMPPAEVLDRIASHRRPHVGLVYSNWPHGASESPGGPRESEVVLAFAGDIKAASDSANRSVDATIEHLDRSLKSQLIPVAPDPGRSTGRAGRMADR